ncbi:S-layer homology domain-containing protein [Bacillus infantis]|uniref:S-layer homology domain-containing protein n=1 Tax=Bacillus infantis TaxID=324767 RepID=UPI00101D79C9|nr:S-layer homology domain-containing protein [Bacillus infantis]RYI28837.1 S-layer homology domain-containing protein [Bacillus infantis]
MIRTKWSTIIMVTVLFLSLFTYTGGKASAAANFTDVPRDKPYASAVYNLSERGIIGGYSDGTFKPGNSITRGQAAAILANLLDLDTENVKDPGFKDVSPELWSYKAIAAAAEKGIFNGYGDGRFGPNDKITRAQMASTLIKAFDFIYMDFRWGDTPFKDLDRLASHRESVYTLYKLGITSGTSETTFSPNDPITRAQAAVLITKTEKVRSTAQLLKPSEFNWSEFNSYENYSDRLSQTGEQDDQVIAVLANAKNKQEYQIVPVKEGKQKLVLWGIEKDSKEREFGHQKFYVTVSSQNGQLKANLEKTDDILPTLARLDVKKQPISKVSLSTMDGKMIDENRSFKTLKTPKEWTSIGLYLDKPGEYIATVMYEDGSKVRYGLTAIDQDEFYTRTVAIEEVLEATVDLSKYAGNNNFSDYKLIGENNQNIMGVIKDGNIFKIKALTEGYAAIQFPQNYKKNGIISIQVRVQKIAGIMQLTPEIYTYSRLFE